MANAKERENCIGEYHFAAQQNFGWLPANFNILQELQREEERFPFSSSCQILLEILLFKGEQASTLNPLQSQMRIVSDDRK